MAISTFRTKRFRPIRLIGEPENIARNRVSSSPANRRQQRSLQVIAADQVAHAGSAGRTCSMGKPRGNHRSHKSDCRLPCETRAGSGPYVRSSGTKCSASHRADTVPERRSSGRNPDSANTIRNGPLSASSGRQIQGRIDFAKQQPRPETNVKRGWCACPAIRCRCFAPAAFPLPERYPRKLSRRTPKRDTRNWPRCFSLPLITS